MQSGLTGGQRSRNRHQDSRSSEVAAAPAAAASAAQTAASASASGENTPAGPLSPGAVVDTLEVATRPSTPEGGGGGGGEESPGGTPGSIRNRRRTSSATKSRDRNPSEDQPSRCATPATVAVAAELEPPSFAPAAAAPSF